MASCTASRVWTSDSESLDLKTTMAYGAIQRN